MQIQYFLNSNNGFLNFFLILSIQIMVFIFSKQFKYNTFIIVLKERVGEGLRKP